MKYASVLLALVAIAAPQRSFAAQPSIWFCPFDFLPRAANYYGSPDYMKLFTPDAPWEKAAGRVSVFKIYPQWADRATDADMKVQFADLRRRRVALALEAGPLTNPPGCWFEGCGGQYMLKMIQRIKSNGGDLQYVAMDEPLCTSFSQKKPGCAAPIQQTVANAVANIKTVLAMYPEIKFGDIEPIINASSDGLSQSELIARYQEGIEAFKTGLGRPLAFFDADLDWNSPTTSDDLRQLRKMVASEKIPFGIIYDGDPGDSTSASWLQTARRHMAFAEATIGAPDIVIFQSWHPQPKKLMPETDQDSFTSIMNSYYGVRTRLSATVTGRMAEGTLETAQGNPVPLARITASARYRSAAGVPAVYRLSGQIPEGTVAVVLGMRANSEGSAGATDVRVSSLEFSAAGTDPVIKRFTTDADLSTWSGLSDKDGVSHGWIENGALHVVTDKSTGLIINSQPTPVSAPCDYTFEVHATIPSGSDGSGYFAVFFMGEKREMRRDEIRFREPSFSLENITTTRSGHWSAALPGSPTAKPEGVIIDAQYDGDAVHWPAEAECEGR